MTSPLALVAPRALIACTLLLGAASLSQGQTYTQDDGNTENAFNLNSASEIGFLHWYDSGAAGDSIAEIRVAIGTGLAPVNGLDGNGLQLAIWDDPNNDGDPSDAVLLYQSAALQVSQSNTDMKVSYPVAPAVAVTDGFFVGIATDANPNEFPVGLDQTGFQAGERAYAFADSATIDLANLSGNSQPPFQQTNAVFLLDAIGGGNPSISVPFCDPMDPNSTGQSTGLVLSLSAAAQSGLHMEAIQGPPGEFGFFLVGTAVSDPGITISQGRLCLDVGGGNAFGRYNVVGTDLNSVGQFDATGVLQNFTGTSSIGSGFDVPSALPLTGNPLIQAGQTWHFQMWHRESGGASNFSNGSSYTF